jgi:16S rRNA (guanine966-N2)-methyltransferase
MRIIAGKYRSRKLVTLEGLTTRPTLDGTKEAIFSSLGGYLNGKVTLDLFGGSGALSLESISRGASKAYIVDCNSNAIQIIKTNCQNLKAENELSIFQMSYLDALERFKEMKFDVIFLDPPFRMKIINELIEFILDHDMLSSSGCIMAEYPVEDGAMVKKDYPNTQIKLCRRYSSSEVLLLKKENL